METELPPYTFEVLDGPEDIRVLEILETTSRIECKLRRTKIAESSYQALSYVWGSEEKPFQAVICDDKGKAIGLLNLTASLQNALCSLRDCSELKSKVFWIDQICINQEATNEKSHQVGLMGKIYKNASRVIVYIGPTMEPEEEIAGIALLQQVSRSFQDCYNLLHGCTTLKSAMESRKRLIPSSGIPTELQFDEKLSPELQEDRYVNQGWRWLCSVAFGEWTRRLWMVQEQLLNREILMLCGCRLLAWDHISVIPILFELQLLPMKYMSRFWLKGRTDAGNFPHDISFAVFLLWNIRGLWDKWCSEGTPSTDPPKQNLLTNLSYYDILECRDPRDRIYALLAISHDTEHLAIAVDYSQDLKSISIQTSIAILKHSQNLEPLAHACIWADSDTTFPSWAMNMSRRRSPLSLPFNVLSPHPNSSKRYAPRFASNNTALLVRGRVLDSLSIHASSTFYTFSFINGFLDNAWFQTAIRFLESYSPILLHFGVTAEKTAQLCRAVMCSRVDWSFGSYDRLASEEETIFCFWSEYRLLLQRANYFSSKSNVKIENGHLFESVFNQLASLVSGRVSNDTLKPTDPLTDEERQYQAEFADFSLISGRSLSFTEQGRICNAMHDVEPGDAVAAFQGADRLYILRPVGDKFRLVGDAFIPGLMFGEGYEGVDPDEVDYDIELI